ncbi:osteoprotegerin a precursor [Oryzias latipes]|nr:osteoprotegerin a precursor [Oryzias latipes]
MVFLLLLQLLLTSGTLGYSLDNPLTYVRKDFVTGKPVTCDACQPGYYLRAHCTATQKSQCAPCPAGSFTAIWNYIDKCLRCSVCGLNEVVKKPCTASNDSQCACKDGYFFHPRYNMCTRHSECPSGQGVLTEGTAEKNTVCHSCPDGTFSNSSSARQNCTQHRSCSDVGLKTVLRGSSWHDSVCGSCDENIDGAEYLKEIIPGIFVHHKMSIKRMRRLVHKLLSEKGEKHSGTSQMSSPQLQAKVEEWVLSSTSSQVHKLIEMLREVGAVHNAEKLSSKLSRIDAFMTDCRAKTEGGEVMYTDIEGVV